MPRVSVIMPVYNCEPYLAECIECILAQSCPDLELILVNDGSTDRSGKIIDEYASRDARILAVHQENGGPSSARNAALELASGEWIYMADGDDRPSPGLLETVIPYLEEGWDLVTFSFDMIPPGKAPRSLVSTRQEKRFILRTDEERFDFLTGAFTRGEIRWEVWNRIFRRDLIEKWGVRFPEGRNVYPEDLCFNYCYLSHASRILRLPDVLYHYRTHPGSFMAGIRRVLKSRYVHAFVKEVCRHYRLSADCAYLTEHFPYLYYVLHKRMLRELCLYQWKHGLDTKTAGELLRENIDDYPAFIQQMTAVFNTPFIRKNYRMDRGLSRQYLDRLYAEEILEIRTSKARSVIRKLVLCLSGILYRCRLRFRQAVSDNRICKFRKSPV